MPNLTREQLQILQHSLGVDQYGRIPKGYDDYTRNYFCAGAKDEEVCQQLVSLGYMQQHPTTQWLPYFNCSVTPEGIEAMKLESPKPPKLTRSQKRYQDYLNFSDAYDCTFREFLDIIKTDRYREMKHA